jgi:hypothetical protein
LRGACHEQIKTKASLRFLRIPLIQLSDQPQPASYFYNRGYGVQSHLVAYHSTDESEIIKNDEALISFIKEFNADNARIF